MSGGVLAVPSGTTVVPDSLAGPEIVVGAAGQIIGGADPTVGSVFSGDGQVQSGGSILLDAAHLTAGGVTVTHNHYSVSFDPAGGTPTPSPPLTRPAPPPPS